ncbi:RpiR family transcriptional regulator [Thalassobacter stenotrophicus]|uniref:Transcriptional regulator, RpiR family n=1 Tax=Lentibacter algarum TaxID=576131 RepID=A0A1H3JMG9_9RHOB|nr:MULTISPECIES: MurR/RpiR family transcriptional regulator [Roseobacteraceae]KGK78079.1 RpiR family transcriptional regulator [Thalassobacter stenotrophicus]WIF33244.1 putative HTH-type transcriptional regulator [Lentibacter algarum]SDY40789.1 transcriptional regulator, RpiR family [Lentibacter algarum]
MPLPIETLLSNSMRNGSKADKAIASYMSGSLTELPFETAASIAAKVKVSEATVGRFCRSIGYESFRNLKEHLKGHIGDHPWLMSERLNELRKNSENNESHLARGMEMEIAALVSVYELATTKNWQRVVKRLAKTERIFITGFQTERGIAQYFANQLQYLRDSVTLMDLAGGNFSELLASDTAACLVIFEARRYSRQAKVLAQEAHGAGIPVTLITDVYCDWGNGVADEVFAVPTQVNQFWDSTALMASLGNLLINGVFMELGPDTGDRLNQIAELFGRITGHVGDPVTQIMK